MRPFSFFLLFLALCVTLVASQRQNEYDDGGDGSYDVDDGGYDDGSGNYDDQAYDDQGQDGYDDEGQDGYDGEGQEGYDEGQEGYDDGGQDDGTYDDEPAEDDVADPNGTCGHCSCQSDLGQRSYVLSLIFFS
jgi:hypothetical protein